MQHLKIWLEKHRTSNEHTNYFITINKARAVLKALSRLLSLSYNNKFSIVYKFNYLYQRSVSTSKFYIRVAECVYLSLHNFGGGALSLQT